VIQIVIILCKVTILSRIFMILFTMSYRFFHLLNILQLHLIIFMLLYFIVRISCFERVTTVLMFVLRTSWLQAKYNDLSMVYLPWILLMCGITNEKKTLLIMYWYFMASLHSILQIQFNTTIIQNRGITCFGNYYRMCAMKFSTLRA